MRRTYGLSTETIKVLSGCVIGVAEEFGCDPSYLNRILGQAQTDGSA